MNEINNNILEIIEESNASDEAKKRGLTHKGFGNYADESGTIVAQSRDGELHDINKKKSPHRWKSKFNAKHHEEPINKKKKIDNTPLNKDELPLQKIDRNKLDYSYHDTNTHKAEQRLSDKTIGKLNRLDYVIESNIGSGSQGTAYQLSNGNVLKVGKDKDEARAMGIIKKNPHPNVVKVERSFYFKDSRDWSDPKKSVMIMDQYYMEEEKLDPLPDYIKHSDISKEFKQYNIPLNKLFGIMPEFFGKLNNKKYVVPDQKILDLKEDEIVKKGFVYLKEKIEEARKNGLKSEDADEVLNDKRYIKFLSDMLRGFSHLYKNGINWQDTHFGNVMYDSKTNNYKIIDLGTSSLTNKEDDVEKLEENVIHIKKVIDKYGRENLGSIQKAAKDWLKDNFEKWKTPTYINLLKKHNYDMSEENLKALALEDFFSKVNSNDSTIKPYLKKYNLKEQWRTLPKINLYNEEQQDEVYTNKYKMHNCNNCVFFKEDRLGSHMLFSALIINEHYCTKESDIIQKYRRDKEEIKRWLLKPGDLNSCPEFLHKKDNLREEQEYITGKLKRNSKSDDIYDKEQLRIGTEIEQEHTTDKFIAKNICKQHLDENPNYYKLLLKYVEKNKKINEDAINDIYPKIQIGSKFKTNDNDILTIKEFESGKFIKIVKLYSEKQKKIILMSFPEIANLITQHKLEFI